MQITDVDENGAILIYRSSRAGFSKYLMGMWWIGYLSLFLPPPGEVKSSKFNIIFFHKGQLLEIANEIYNLELKVRILDGVNEQASGGTAGPIDLASGLKSVVVKFRLDFDNREYVCGFILLRKSSNNNFC